jgi:hypothetical protein
LDSGNAKMKRQRPCPCWLTYIRGKVNAQMICSSCAAGEEENKHGERNRREGRVRRQQKV